MGYNMKGFGGFGEGTGSAAKFKSSPVKGTPSATHTHPHPKSKLSSSEKQDIEDQRLIDISLDKGSAEEDATATKKSIRRQIVKESYDEPRKELKKYVKGSKLKKFLTSTEKLRAEASARQMKGATVRGEVKEIED